MALPASGQISMDDIRIELGVPTQIDFGLDQARDGDYGAINQCSTYKPPSTGQISLSDWYGYNHTQVCVYEFCCGYNASDCCAAITDYQNNCNL